MRIPYLPISMFHILSGPAQLWVWICAKMCGVTIEYETFDETVDEDSHE